MKFYLNTNDLTLSDSLVLEISKSVEKINNLLPHLAEDQLTLNINIKLHKGSLYRVKLILVLPEDTLVVKVYADALGKAVKGGFDKLIEQVKHYKEKHFKSLSDYPKKDSIRKKGDNNLWMEMLTR